MGGGNGKEKQKGKGLLQHFSETYHSVSWLVGDPVLKPCCGFYGVGRIWLSCKQEPPSSRLCSMCPSLLTSQANSWEVQARDTPLSYWAALVAGISTGSAAFPTMGYTRASFMGLCRFKCHQYYHLLNVSLPRPLVAGSGEALCSAPLLAPGQAPSRHSLLPTPYQVLALCPKCVFFFKSVSKGITF